MKNVSETFVGRDAFALPDISHILLSATKNVTKSADGEMVCKRQAVVGSNFKRKICMTQDQWEQMQAESQKTTGDIQRRQGPGVTN